MVLLADMAEIRLLNEPASSLKPRMIIFHTMNGTLRGTDSFFRETVATESHFGIGGSSDQGLDGVIWQWVDTERRADANRNANAFALSIETSDGADPDQPWSPRQLASLIALTRRLAELHDIPMRIVTSADDPIGGLGWHVMFGAPGPWALVAKTCPGPVRIAQLHDIVFPALGIGVSPPPPKTSSLEESMLIYAALGSIWLLHSGKSYRFDLPDDVQRLKDQGVPDAGNMSPAFHALFPHVPQQ